MSVQTAYSTKPLEEAVSELRGVIHGTPELVLFFASSHYDPNALSSLMQRAFENARVVGCSSAGEIASGRMLTGSITLMALDRDMLSQSAVAVVENLGAGMDIVGALNCLEQQTQASRSDWDIAQYVGIVLMDGLSGAEERLMEKLGDSTDVFFVGGSAGDDMKFQATYVCADGKAFANSAVLILLKLERGFDIVKTQSFRSLGKRLVATQVDEERRAVLQFNHQPALDAYAAALGISADRAPNLFFEHPLGLMVDGEPFVRSPQKAEGRNMVFFCHIKEGMELELLQSTDIVPATLRKIETARATGELSGLIEFQCILRTLQLRKENRCGSYVEIFAGIPMAGFSTYGEAYLGHMNQTSTMLLFH